MYLLLLYFPALLFGKEPTPGRHIGSIDPFCNVVNVLRDAYENARFLCDQYYLVSPDLVLKEQNSLENGSPIQIVYVPSHLYHIVFELFKNAMRAVVEHHGMDVMSYPPVEAVVVLGKEDISIRVSWNSNLKIPSGNF